MFHGLHWNSVMYLLLCDIHFCCVTCKIYVELCAHLLSIQTTHPYHIVTLDFLKWCTCVWTCALGFLGDNKIVRHVLVENLSSTSLTRWHECLPQWCWPKKENCCIKSYKCPHHTFTYAESSTNWENSCGYSCIEIRTIRTVTYTKKKSLWKIRFPSIHLNIIFVYSSPVSWFIFRNHVISASMQYALGTDFTHKFANTV
jgi:hypothetical protein